MHLKREILPTLFSRADILRGKRYRRQGQIHDLQMRHTSEGEEIACKVQESGYYNRVSVSVKGQDVSIYCSCPRFANGKICDHIVAAMLASEDLRDEILPAESDIQAKSMLRYYMDKSDRQIQEKPDQLVRLVPRIDLEDDDYPSFSFQVGVDRLYVVKDIRKFLESVAQQETVRYGKDLEFCHALDRFDQDAQELIAILMDQLAIGHAIEPHPIYPPYGTKFFPGSSPKNQIVLTGSAFDRVFDLFQDKQMEDVSGKERYAFVTRDPKTVFSFAKRNKAAELRVRMEEGPWRFFGDPQHLYAIGRGQILRCSRKFCEGVFPLLESGEEWMRFSFHDLSDFCNYVLPEIQDVVTIDDPSSLLQEYSPDECVPYFLFDMDDDGALLLQVDFRYGNVTFHCFEQPDQAVKRDIRTEKTVLAFVEQWFPDQDGGQFILTGDDAVYGFLTGELERFREIGEVRGTDRLLKKHIQPACPSVEISVSDGILWLDFDAGGFPLEELEALYQSLRKRKRYHRLPDGRYLSLDGSPCETMAKMSHMLQLSPKDLGKGPIQLPVFRALALDSLLSGQEDIQVKWDRSLREMVRDLKSAPEGGYALPKGLEGILRPYQVKGYQWLKTLANYGLGGILADEMGLGKTLQMIAFLESLGPVGQDGPSLVVCPASLILNWADELDKFAPGLTYALIMGTAKERSAQIASSGDRSVWITSYELLRQDIEQYAPLQFNCCILDEAQRIKNRSTQTSQAVKHIDCRQRFVMTGTPIENRLSELWNLFDFLMPEYLFSYNTFAQKLERPAVKDKDEHAMDQLRRLVQPFILRRLKKDVLKELPSKIEHVRWIPLSEEERKVYLAAKVTARQTLEVKGDNGRMAFLKAFMELRRICCAPGLQFENYKGPSSKLDDCIELCAEMVENGHQILLFSQFTSMLEQIGKRLDEEHISHYTLQGSTPTVERDRSVKAFNAGGASVFLISLNAGGTGLNLTAADIVIHYDPWWNPAVQEQATDRAHRIGQRSSVQVYKLIAKDTIEEKVMELQSKKAELVDAVMGNMDNGILEMSKEELLALLD